PTSSLFDPPSGGGGQAEDPEPVAVEAVIPPAPAPLSDVTLTCDSCERSFGSLHALRVHQGRAHRGAAPEPPAKIPAPTLIRAHDVLPFKCFGCERGFASGPELAEHRRSYEHRQRVGGA